MIRHRAIAWLGAVLAAIWFFGAMSSGQFVDSFQPADYLWLVAGREFTFEATDAASPWIAYWRPVMKAFFAGATALFGADALAYMRLVLLLHILNGLLVADIALKFRAGPYAAAIGSLYFLIGKHHLAVLDSVAGASVLFPAFLGLLGLRLAIARGTAAHFAAIFVLAAAIWARETYALLPLAVILLLPGEERGWAHLTPRFALSMALLSAGYLATRWFWQGGIESVAEAELERSIDGSPGGLLTNLWALLRVATVPPRHVDGDGFWVALLALMMLLAFSTHLKISRHRILRLLFAAVLVFLPSALLRPTSAESAIAYSEPHHLYGPACFAAIAVCLLITLRPTDQRSDGEGYEDTCLRAIGEFLTLALMLVLMLSNMKTRLERAQHQRSTAQAAAAQLAELEPWVRSGPAARPLLLFAGSNPTQPSLLGEARTLQAYAEWIAPGRGMDLRFVRDWNTAQLRTLNDLPGRQWISAIRPGIQELAVLFWDRAAHAYRGEIPSAGRWIILAPASPDGGAIEFVLQGQPRSFDYSVHTAYASEFTVVHEAITLEADPSTIIAPRQLSLVPPSDLLLMLKL